MNRKRRSRGESAGTEAGKRVNPLAVEVMSELGISTDDQRPKQLTSEKIAGATCIITMGCGVDTPSCPVNVDFTDDWGLEDPAGKPIEKGREIRDEIRVRVERLLTDLDKEGNR